MDKTRKPYPQKARERIQAGMILDRLNKHVMGEVDLTATQVQSARILLGKVIPDLKQEDKNVNGEVNQKHSFDKQSIEQAAESIVERINAIGSGDSEENA